jgi:hypothetical protein
MPSSLAFSPRGKASLLCSFGPSSYSHSLITEISTGPKTINLDIKESPPRKESSYVYECLKSSDFGDTGVGTLVHGEFLYSGISCIESISGTPYSWGEYEREKKSSEWRHWKFFSYSFKCQWFKKDLTLTNKQVYFPTFSEKRLFPTGSTLFLLCSE